MTPEEFRANGYAMIDWVADYLEGVERYPVRSTVEPGDVRAQLPEQPPTEPDGFEAVMRDLDRVVVPGLTHWQHPNFHAWYPANVTYPSILAELLIAGLGVQGMSWATSPACTEVETLMLDWMATLLDLPAEFRSTSEHGGGVIQGSASEATITSILAARWQATGGEINSVGGGTLGSLVAYTTTEANSSIEKGLRISGIGSDQVRFVATDSTHAMDPTALAAQIDADRAAGLQPFWVCSTRGTTSSMAFDPTAAIGAITRREGLWLHVDAAMSGVGALAPEHRWINDGLELVDSMCTNPHKWMGINFDCDLLWVRDRRPVLGALSILPEYLRSKAGEAGAVIDYRDWQVPLGRRFRALKLWFGLRIDGVDSYVDMIRRHVALTQELAGWVAADDRFEIVAPHPLNLLCIRLRAGDEATDQLIEAANASGRALFTRTTLAGASVLRISIGGRATEQRHVAAMWELLQTLA